MGLTRKQIVIVVILLAGTLLAVLNQTLLSPALPAIMADTQVERHNSSVAYLRLFTC